MRSVRAFLAALVVLATVPSGGGPAGATGAFGADAAAASMRFAVTFPNFPVTPTPVDLGGTVAQAHLDSLGNSKAFAASPYPGDFAVSAPGLLPGFIPGFPALPAYPLLVTSKDPSTPTAEQSAGPINLTAASSSDTSTASCTLGLPPTISSHSIADVHHDGDAVVATATGEASGIAVGPLTIASVRSVATVRLGADGALQRSSELNIGDIALNGTALRLSPDGLELLGQKVPGLDAGSADAIVKQLGVGSVADLLATLGLDVTYLAEQQTADGVISAGVAIRYQAEVGALGRGTVEVVLGQVSARASGAPTSPPTRVAAPAPVATSATTTPAAAVARASTPANPPPPEPFAAAPSAVRTADAMASFSLSSFYAVLVGAAAAAVLVSQSMRMFAVRKP